EAGSASFSDGQAAEFNFGDQGATTTAGRAPAQRIGTQLISIASASRSQTGAAMESAISSRQHYYQNSFDQEIISLSSTCFATVTNWNHCNNNTNISEIESTSVVIQVWPPSGLTDDDAAGSRLRVGICRKSRPEVRTARVFERPSAKRFLPACGPAQPGQRYWPNHHWLN
uniref:Kinesin motor domain-containing protein n=1 Tax=Macrostomum lignano TaxID=282301 RepID=A0A1I8F6F5_9PLAT